MADVPSPASQPATPKSAPEVPLPVLVVFRGIGQVFFQDNAATGALFALGIALSSPIMAAGLIIGSVIGSAVAWGLKFDKAEVLDGIYGFNAALVGIATFFFFQPGVESIGLLLVGCVVAALVTRAARKGIPFPTYTAPFVVTTWAVFFLGKSLGAAAVTAYPLLVPNIPLGSVGESVGHGIGQVMFQASIWTGILFLVGIAINNREHATWVLVGSILGAMIAGYHIDAGDRALDPEQLIERDQFENIRLGLYGYNATLAPIALFLWRRSLIAPVLGIILSVPLTELVPRLGLPALTAPFVLATWLVLAFERIESKLFGAKTP